MTYHPEPERTLKGTAARKRSAAERHDLQAQQLRLEAAELERRWTEFKRRRDGMERVEVTK